ncbi:hypothetical protein ACRE1S_03380 [Helicobacter himalayensis]|uniref:hypothetical protein n=1 Tax=Helicobacter himalayensis TaxID=1591088 RepID=UPI003D6FCE63
MIFDTGATRSILGHAVSGGIASLMISGVYNYTKFKNGEISLENALQHTFKAATEGALITACAVGVANALGSQKDVLNNLLESGAYLALGVAGSYAIRNFCVDSQKITSR